MALWEISANVHLTADHLAERADCVVVYLPRVHIEPFKNRSGTWFPTCVSVCQRFTGLTFWAFTPYTYYRALLKKGGHVLGNPFSKPKTDNSLLQQQQREADEAKQRELDAKAKQEDLRRRQRSGRRSLLGTGGDELGVA